MIVPTWNEAATITQVLADLAAAFPEPDALFVVCDDDSPDGTAARVSASQAHDPRIHLLTAPRVGIGAAYARGFAYAAANGAGVVIQHDADGSHRAPDARVLYETLTATGCAVALGTRNAPGARLDPRWPRRRRLLSACGRLLLKAAGLPTSDPTSGLKAIRTDALRHADPQAVARRHPGFSFQPALLAALAPHATFTEVPIVFRDRQAGESKLRTADVTASLRFALTALAARLRFFAAYYLVAGSGILVNLTAFETLTTLGVQPLAASPLAVATSILTNFLAHGRFVFGPSARPFFGRLWRYALISTLTVSINTLVFRLLHRHVLPAHDPLVHQFLTILCVVPVTFTFIYVHRRWTFRRPDADPETHTRDA